MGCIGSRLAVVRNRSLSGSQHSRTSLRRGNVFPVLNIDDMGQHVNPGKLEVTETDLVLHVRGKPSLTWPLRSLRRYGYDNDLFSFESGRRCPTGAGIFGFQCHRAQSLFNLLQSKIQGNTGNTPNTVPSTPISPTNTCSNNPSTPVSSTFVYVNLAENSSSRQTSNAPDVTQVHSNAMPTGLNSYSASYNGGGEPGSSLPSGAQSQKPLDNCHPLYMNIEGPPVSHTRSNAHPQPATRASSIPYSAPQTQSKPSQYSVVNHQLERRLSGSGQFNCSMNDSPNSLLYTNVICSPNHDKILSAQFGISPFEPAEVNYAELDLKTDNSAPSTNPLLPISAGGKKRGFFLGGKENGKPALSDSKFRLKFGRSNPITAPSVGEATSSPFPTSTNSALSPLNRSNPVGGPSCGLDSNTATPPNNGELGYATIDFDRTAALSVVSTRSKVKVEGHLASSSSSAIALGQSHDIPGRKTRHNSTAL